MAGVSHNTPAPARDLESPGAHLSGHSPYTANRKLQTANLV